MSISRRFTLKLCHSTNYIDFHSVITNYISPTPTVFSRVSIRACATS